MELLSFLVSSEQINIYNECFASTLKLRGNVLLRFIGSNHFVIITCVGRHQTRASAYSVLAEDSSAYDVEMVFKSSKGIRGLFSESEMSSHEGNVNDKM